MKVDSSSFSCHKVHLIWFKSVLRSSFSDYPHLLAQVGMLWGDKKKKKKFSRTSLDALQGIQPIYLTRAGTNLNLLKHTVEMPSPQHQSAFRFCFCSAIFFNMHVAQYYFLSKTNVLGKFKPTLRTVLKQSLRTCIIFNVCLKRYSVFFS